MTKTGVQCKAKIWKIGEKDNCVGNWENNTSQKNDPLTDTNTHKNSHTERKASVSKCKMEQDLLVHSWSYSMFSNNVKTGTKC